MARGEREEVQTVDVRIGAGKEVGQIRLVDTLRKDLDVHLGVNVFRHCRQHIDLRLANAGNCRTNLAVEIDNVERVKIGNVERTDAKSHKRQEVNAADAAHAGDSYTLAPKNILLFRGDPTDVA